MENDLGKIPEWHFDLIARVIPGMCLIGIYLIDNAELFRSFATVIFGLVFAYVLGFCIEGLAEIVIDRCIWSRLVAKRPPWMRHMRSIRRQWCWRKKGSRNLFEHF